MAVVWSHLLSKFKKPSAEVQETADDPISRLHVYNALWSLPDHISGMENSALRRMVDFQRHGGPRSMTLLTFNPRVDVAADKARLVGEGRMNDATRLRNIWSDLRRLTDDQLRTFTGQTPSEPIPIASGLSTDEASHFTVHRDANNRITRRTYTRADGTTLAVHITTKNQKRFILFDAGGTPITEWNTPNELFKQWLNHAVTEKPAVLIIDDKKIGEFAHTIPHRTFSTVLFVHGSHLETSADGPHSPILKSRRNTIKNLSKFDLVALQTRQQRDHLRARSREIANTRIIPSSLPAEAFTSDNARPRDEHAGIVVATLSALKRVDQSIRGIHKARQDGANVSLTVCGDGVERDSLETLVNDLALTESVTFQGQVGDVPNQLAASSFSLLTSTTEGHPLMLIESMAAGCIPISYDIVYGPRDIITHGVDGLIVPYGDIGALALQIRNFVNLSTTDRERMRVAAVRRARDYGSAENVGRWSQALQGL